MARIPRLRLAVVSLVLLLAAARAQPTTVTSDTPSSRPPAIAMLRAQLRILMDMQAEMLAGEIGPPPGNCRVDVSHIDHDELGEGFAEFVADVFNRAYWKVEVSAAEPLACAPPGILIEFSPAALPAAATLQAALNERERTDIAPIWVDDPRTCSLRVTVGPQ